MKVVVERLLAGASRARGLCVLVDVFRSSNTMLAMFASGAKEIVQVAGLEDALKLKRQHQDWVLFGERGGFPPEGFEHGNSPVEAMEADLDGCTAILCTSAGSAGIYAMTEASGILVGSFANASAVANAVRDRDPELVTLVAIGKEGTERAPEDELCCKYLAFAIRGRPGDFPRVREDILASTTAQRLRDRGQSADLKFCLRLDLFDTVPEVAWANGIAVVRPG